MSKVDKIKEILAVLDLTEEERQKEVLARYLQPKPWMHGFTEKYTDKPNPRWLVKCRHCQNTWEFIGYNIEQVLTEENRLRDKDCPNPSPLTESLADLAFRLRDETEKHEWETGLVEVYEHLNIPNIAFGFWARSYCKPIHWIIAALVAKELAKKDGKKVIK